MVQFLNTTYRIMKVDHCSYEVIRLLDDASVGTFEIGQRLCVHPIGVAHDLLLQIAMTALKQAKVSWTRVATPSSRPSGTVPRPPRNRASCPA